MNTEKISQQHYSFDEASDLLCLIEEQKAFILGQSIRAVYGSFFYLRCYDYHMSFIILDCVALGVRFISESSVEIVIADKSDFETDGELNEDNEQKIIFRSKLSEIQDGFLFWNRSCPIQQAKILDIIVDRHSNEIEADASNTIREEGGDYFSSIRFILEGGFEFVTRYGGYDSTYTGFWNLPKSYLQEALQVIPLNIDTHHELCDILKVTKISPDELAQEAIDFIKRCAKAGYWAPEIGSLLQVFYRHGMNCDYISENGDTIHSTISKLGDKSIYTMRDFLELKKR